MSYPELDNLFRDLLAANRGPGYGGSVRDAKADLSFIEVDLWFVAGRTYCCAEPSCHLPFDGKQLRQLAAERAIVLPESVMIRWHCHVEKGAKLECMAKLGLPAESDGYDFEVTHVGYTAR